MKAHVAAMMCANDVQAQVLGGTCHTQRVYALSHYGETSDAPILATCATFLQDVSAGRQGSLDDGARHLVLPHVDDR